jgi:CheY-like chemotaxis protein
VNPRADASPGPLGFDSQLEPARRSDNFRTKQANSMQEQYVKPRTRILAVSDDGAFLHLIQTLLDDMDLSVRTTAQWHEVQHIAAKLLPDLTILDLTPTNETACWLVMEALKAHAATKHMSILICPVASWLIDGHRERLSRLGASVWSGKFELQEFLESVSGAVGLTVASKKAE